MNDLQVTRIGRTISDLRKIDGEVGVAAKALIAKWKSMVVAETISSSESDGEDDNGTSVHLSHKMILFLLATLDLSHTNTFCCCLWIRFRIR